MLKRRKPSDLKEVRNGEMGGQIGEDSVEPYRVYFFIGTGSFLKGGRDCCHVNLSETI